MKDNKILTISIAAYNAEKYIDKCISSLTCIKNFDKLDVVIVDDGSKDETYSIAKNYEQKFVNSIKVIKKENGGWGSTINTSLNIADGKYYKTLDVDDFFNSKNLDDFIIFLEKTSSDIVISPFEYYYINKNQYELNHKYKYQIHALTFKTSMLKNNNVQITEKCFYTDVELCLMGIKYSKTEDYFDKSIYIYSVGISEQSISEISFKKNIEQHKMILQELIENQYNHIIVCDKYDYKIKQIFTERIIEMIYKHYSILFKFKPYENGKGRIKDFDLWLKKASIVLYNNVKLKRVKIFRMNDNFYLIIYILIFIRSFLYNLIKGKGVSI